MGDGDAPWGGNICVSIFAEEFAPARLVTVMDGNPELLCQRHLTSLFDPIQNLQIGLYQNLSILEGRLRSSDISLSFPPLYF